MTTEQHLTAALPLTAGSGFASSLYNTLLLQNYVTTVSALEERTAAALESGDITTAIELATVRTGLDTEVFSFSFEA